MSNPNLDGFNLFGKAIKNRARMVSTPEKDRRQKREHLTQLERRYLPEGDTELEFDWDFVDVEQLEMDKIPEEMLNEFPSWDNQISGGYISKILKG